MLNYITVGQAYSTTTMNEEDFFIQRLSTAFAKTLKMNESSGGSEEPAQETPRSTVPSSRRSKSRSSYYYGHASRCVAGHR